MGKTRTDAWQHREASEPPEAWKLGGTEATCAPIPPSSRSCFRPLPEKCSPEAHSLGQAPASYPRLPHRFLNFPHQSETGPLTASLPRAVCPVSDSTQSFQGVGPRAVKVKELVNRRALMGWFLLSKMTTVCGKRSLSFLYDAGRHDGPDWRRWDPPQDGLTWKTSCSPRRKKMPIDEKGLYSLHKIFTDPQGSVNLCKSRPICERPLGEHLQTSA